MKKYAAKILSLVLCLSLVSTCLTPAYAAAAGERSDLAQYIDYANSLLPSLSRLPDTDLPGEDLLLSQPLEILNDNDDTNYAFFLFHESTCVGELVVTRLGGEFAASFLAAELPRVSAAYAGEVPVCLVSGEQALLLCSDTGAEVIVGELAQDASALRANAAEPIAARARKEPLTLTLVESVESVQRVGLPSSSKTLSVDFVQNSYVDGHGICWAAATASIIRRLQNRKDLTAVDVYNTLVLEFGGRPILGYRENVVLAFKCYGITYYITRESKLPFSMVVNSINLNYPVYMAMLGKDGENEGIFHAAVLCGYKSESDYTDYYQIMDPNVREGNIWITVNRNTDNITYPLPNGGGTYTDWYWPVYSSHVG